MVENATTHNTQIVRDDDNEGTTMAVFRKHSSVESCPAADVFVIAASCDSVLPQSWKDCAMPRMNKGRKGPCCQHAARHWMLTQKNELSILGL